MRQMLRSIVERLYLGLFTLYPGRFRAVFGEEIQEIFFRLINEAEDANSFDLLALYFYELKSLAVSILRERWHELKTGKEKEMAPENGFNDSGVSLVKVGPPGIRWVFLWTLLMAVAILVGWLLMAPIAALLLGVVKWGAMIGILPEINGEMLQPVGLFAGLALAYSSFQWLMIRNHLPGGKSWFIGTATGFLVAGAFIGMEISIVNRLNINVSQRWAPVMYFLSLGLTVGFAQWLVLRRILRNAFWILVIDTLAAGSFLVSGEGITSFGEFFIVLTLPGLVTGIGFWILLKWAQFVITNKEYKYTTVKPKRRSKKWLFVGTLSLVPLFFIFIWVYATSQLAIAKSRGIYPTAEAAVIATNSQGWGGARVIKVTNVHAGPNQGGGAQPHVWFGGCTVYLDRVPAGWDRDEYLSGSFYLHVRDGWVYVPEGAFPEFIGAVMELYDIEGVNEWKLENQ